MGIDDRNLDLTHHKKYRRQTAKMMFFAFGNLIYISVLLVNAIAILSEDRFLARGTYPRVLSLRNLASATLALLSFMQSIYTNE